MKGGVFGTNLGKLKKKQEKTGKARKVELSLFNTYKCLFLGKEGYVAIELAGAGQIFDPQERLQMQQNSLISQSCVSCMQCSQITHE